MFNWGSTWNASKQKATIAQIVSISFIIIFSLFLGLFLLLYLGVAVVTSIHPWCINIFAYRTLPALLLWWIIEVNLVGVTRMDSTVWHPRAASLASPATVVWVVVAIWEWLAVVG
jgi:hypothetical protein